MSYIVCSIAEYITFAHFRRCSYDHHWLFPREFHVSPFNDRSGFYGISVVLPFDKLPSPASLHSLEPRARVRVDLYTAQASSPPAPGPLKLIALIDPLTSAQLTSSNLVNALAKQPLVLFTAWSKILYNAWVLHYVKRLDVFVRPDPKPAVPGWPAGEELKSLDPAGGVGWQEETWTECFARRRVEAFLKKRVEELGMMVTLKPANPAIPTRHFAPANRKDLQDARTLVVSYLSPTLYSTFFLAPSAAHALMMGEENQFKVSSIELFLWVFGARRSAPCTDGLEERDGMSFTQRWRVRQIPPSCNILHRIPTPAVHPLDSTNTFTYFLTILTLFYTSFMDNFTRFMYASFGARFVKGQEPWSRRTWERVAGQGDALRSYLDGDVAQNEDGETYRLGSVRTVA